MAFYLVALALALALVTKDLTIVTWPVVYTYSSNTNTTHSNISYHEVISFISAFIIFGYILLWLLYCH